MEEQRAEITLRVSDLHREELLKLLDAPGVRYRESRGWVLTDFRISAPPDVMQALRPKLQAWREQCQADDAW